MKRDGTCVDRAQLPPLLSRLICVQWAVAEYRLIRQVSLANFLPGRWPTARVCFICLQIALIFMRQAENR